MLCRVGVVGPGADGRLEARDRFFQSFFVRGLVHPRLAMPQRTAKVVVGVGEFRLNPHRGPPMLDCIQPQLFGFRRVQRVLIAGFSGLKPQQHAEIVLGRGVLGTGGQTVHQRHLAGLYPRHAFAFGYLFHGRLQPPAVRKFFHVLPQSEGDGPEHQEPPQHGRLHLGVGHRSFREPLK